MSTLEIAGLCLSYGKTEILKGIDLTLKTGRIQALIGPNGAGKSTTMRVLSGLSIPKAGVARLNGEKLNRIEQIRNHCGFLIESPVFHNYLTGLDNLKLLLQLSNSNQSATELIRLVGLEKHQNKKFSDYSRGMKQRLGIAQAIIGNPSFLILDEPFHGLDPEVKLDFMNLFRGLANKGTGVLITSHLLSEIESIADDFILLNRGKVYLSGKMTDYSGERQHVKLYFQKFITKNLSFDFKLELDNNSLKGYLTRNETEQLIIDLAKHNIIPYKVERSSILYDKYMEIT